MTKLPIHERGLKTKEFDNEVKQSNNPLVRMLSPWVKVAQEAECRSQTVLRAMTVALACERYRLKHNRWPADLDALVQAKLLTEVPLDPIDGQPLRYRPFPEGVSIYSIGLNRIDDNGNIGLDGMSGDLGIYLWDVARRRSEPLPDIAIPEGQDGK